MELWWGEFPKNKGRSKSIRQELLAEPVKIMSCSSFQFSFRI